MTTDKRLGHGMTLMTKNLIAQMHKDGHNTIVVCDPKYDVV